MDRAVYQRLAELEGEHWWFVARRQIITELIARHTDLPPTAQILEAGCGTGGNLAMLAEFGNVVAFEPDAVARQLASEKSGFEIRDGRLPEQMPFDEVRFDLVAALDVVEHLDDDAASLRALAAAIRPGGWLLVTVPAFGFLWSRHDEVHHHKRRYRKPDMLSPIREAGLTPCMASYFNTLLFPAVLMARYGKKLFHLDHNEDDRLPGPMANRVLQSIFASERHLVGRLPMPVGVSLAVLARKPAQ